MSLSDSFCVDRHRDEFQHLAEHHIDILFANEAEIKSLYQVADFDEALQHVRHHVDVAALTRSEKGSVLLRGWEHSEERRVGNAWASTCRSRWSPNTYKK